jgi:hypothetical protein
MIGSAQRMALPMFYWLTPVGADPGHDDGRRYRHPGVSASLATATREPRHL